MNQYRFDEIKVGQTVEFLFDIDEYKMDMFRVLSGDCNPLHNDLSYAEQCGYQEKVVYGQLTAAALSTLAGVYLPGKYSLIHSIETSFVSPVFISKCPLRVLAEVKDKDERFSLITVKYNIFDTDRTKVCKGKMKIGVMK